MIFRSYAAWFVSVAVTLLVDQDPTAPLRGKAFLTGSFQTPQKVPEPKINLVLIGVEVTAAGFLLRQRRLRSAA